MSFVYSNENKNNDYLSNVLIHDDDEKNIETYDEFHLGRTSKQRVRNNNEKYNENSGPKITRKLSEIFLVDTGGMS